MKILNYNIESFVNFNEDSIEKFLGICETAIENITKDKHVQFKLKSVLHELIINSIEHGYNKSSGKVGCNLKSTSESFIIEIADEGTGLATTNEKVFNSNYDISHLDSRGWGLPLINKLSSGRMNIAQNKPKGTKISVTIPK